MFRNPREASAAVAGKATTCPSTGRPPTPPLLGKEVPENTPITTYSMGDATATPLLGKSKTLPKRTPNVAVGKAKGKANGNGNIMSFFKRAESGGTNCTEIKSEEDSLFLEEKPANIEEEVPTQTPTPPRDEVLRDELSFGRDDSPIPRYNESMEPVKRRRMSESIVVKSAPSVDNVPEITPKGPFADDSDSDEDCAMKMKTPRQLHTNNITEKEIGIPITTPPSHCKPNNDDIEDFPTPKLKRERTSIGEVNDFDGVEDFIDDEFPEEGEEYMERCWMEMQAEVEMGLEDDDQAITEGPEKLQEEPRELATGIPRDAGSSSCPICGGSTDGLAEQASTFIQRSCFS